MKRFILFLLLPLILLGTADANDKLHRRTRYVLRPGDSLELNYRLTPEFNQTVTVQPDGFVDLNVVGDVKVEGMTVDDLRVMVIEKASKRLNQPELNITLKDFDKPYIVVAGEVERPGKLDLRDNTTAMQAILLAGGFKGSGYDTNVYLFRKLNNDTAEVHKLNLHDITKTKDLERDMTLQSGDMILVPRNKLEKFSRFMKASNLGVFFDPTNIVK